MEDPTCKNMTKTISQWKETADRALCQLKSFIAHHEAAGNLTRKIEIEKDARNLQCLIDDLDYLENWLRFYSFISYRIGRNFKVTGSFLIQDTISIDPDDIIKDDD